MIKWALKALSDSDFASDKETRISVFGYIIYFYGIPIAWRSKGMKSVVLSTTEAEYTALSEVVKEFKFIVKLLQTKNIEVELPIVEISVFSIGLISSCADQFNSWGSPMQRLLVYMYLSQLMSTFTNYLKVHHSLDGFFIL